MTNETAGKPPENGHAERLQTAMEAINKGLEDFHQVLRDSGLKFDQNGKVIMTRSLAYTVQQPGTYAKAASLLRTFLSDGSRLASDCYEYLLGHGITIDIGTGKGLNGNRVRRMIPARAFQQNKAWWWESQLPTVVEPEAKEQ